MKVEEIRRWVVKPILERAKLWSASAENLVLGTGLCESGYDFLDQRDQGSKPGPAFGPWQIEEATYQSLWTREISVANRLQCLAALGLDGVPPVDELHGNLFLGALVCRLKYLTIKEALPSSGDSIALARYWKTYYNTSVGKGYVVNAIAAFNVVCF